MEATTAYNKKELAREQQTTRADGRDELRNYDGLHSIKKRSWPDWVISNITQQLQKH